MESIAFVKSDRGKYILSKALFIAIRKLKKESEVFINDAECKKDLEDMQTLYQNLYGSYSRQSKDTTPQKITGIKSFLDEQIK